MYSLNKNPSFLTSIFFSHFLVFFFDERVCGQAAEGGEVIYRVAKWEWFPSLNLQYMVVELECVFIVLR